MAKFWYVFFSFSLFLLVSSFFVKHKDISSYLLVSSFVVAIIVWSRLLWELITVFINRPKNNTSFKEELKKEWNKNVLHAFMSLLKFVVYVILAAVIYSSLSGGSYDDLAWFTAGVSLLEAVHNLINYHELITKVRVNDQEEKQPKEATPEDAPRELQEEE